MQARASMPVVDRRAGRRSSSIASMRRLIGSMPLEKCHAYPRYSARREGRIISMRVGWVRERLSTILPCPTIRLMMARAKHMLKELPCQIKPLIPTATNRWMN